MQEPTALSLQLQAELAASLSKHGAIAESWASASGFKAKSGEVMLIPSDQVRKVCLCCSV
jgi:hypothetical protein